MEERRVQPGFRSGLLEVVSEAPRIRGRRAWLCRCDCGGEKVVSEHHLNTEHTRSCGCLSNRKPLKADMHIGQLTLLAEAPKRNGYRYWHCRCDCGNTCTIQESHIRTGHTKSCGCLSVKKAREKAFNLSGRRFERLEVIGAVPEYRDGIPKWLCRCSCGNEVYVGAEHLLREKTKSCGCLREEQRKVNMEKAIHFADGTCIEKIAAPRETVANTSGHRGVYQRKNGSWRALITFRGKRYDLGTHKTFEEAVDARLRGEEKYFGEYLEEYYAKQRNGQIS